MSSFLSLPNLRIGSNKSRVTLAPLQFPADLGDYHMILNFRQYDYSTARTNTQGRIADSIALPLPSSIVDSSRIEVGGKQVGSLGQLAATAYAGLEGFDSKSLFNQLSAKIQSGLAAAEAAIPTGDQALNTIRGALNNPSGTAFNMLDAVAQGVRSAGAVGSYALRGIASKITPQIEQGLGAAIGNAMNPHATLVFDGVDLKIHNFDWVLAPKNSAEQSALQKIIEKIQYHIHPEYRSVLDKPTGFEPIDRGLLAYPSLLEVILVGVAENYIIKFNKYMMVNQFNVDYTSQGGLVFNRGGKPAVLRLSLNVTESQIRTKEDYSSRSATSGLQNTRGRESRIASPGDTLEEAGILSQGRTEQGNNATLPPQPAALPNNFPAPGELTTSDQSELLKNITEGANYSLPGEPLTPSQVQLLDDARYNPNSDQERISQVEGAFIP